ncbi:MAG TPA: efflux RND transporter periplasmic adaptor subunit [Candidatus Paceibacterota bacterium]|nr:efflux RND transporter periplasmic adaptor subunit [Candidatus Paceibacterota bacterium]
MPQRFRSLFSSVKSFAMGHKIWATIIAVAVLGGGYWAYAKVTTPPAQTHYIMGTVATGTIVASVSESGQVSTTDSIDVQPQVSGVVTWVGVKAGDHVRAGQAIATIDDTTARQSLIDAQKQYATDQLTFQQSQAQAPINYQNDQTALQNAQTDLEDDYNTTYNDLTSTYLDLPAVISNANENLYGYELDPKKNQWNMDVLPNLFTAQEDTSKIKSFKTSAVSEYTTANSEYDTALSAYQTSSRTAGDSAIDTLLTQSINMTTDVAQTIQTELNFMGAVSDLAQTYNMQLPSAFTTLQSNARTNLSTANTHLSTLLADKKTIDNAKQTIQNDQNTVALDKVGNPDGSNPITLQVSQNNLEKEAADIESQKTDLAKYTITAPFAGTVSVVNAKVGANAPSAAATIITDSQIAQLSLNEVDAAKVQLGDKVTLTFDAIDGLSLTGTVSEIDPVGTVSQGVVSYDLKVSFDTQDPRVKPGMTVNADIQTAVAQNTLVVPSSAVKTTGGQSYVLAFDPTIPQSEIATAGSAGIVSSVAPIQIPVTVGITDNSNVQILSGLSSGQQIVVSSRSGSATTVSTAARTGSGNALFGGGGAVRAGGATGAVRIGG